jgi:tetratricopeptide (TPR) repeat protein
MIQRSLALSLLVLFPLTSLFAQDALRQGKIAFAKRNYKEALTLLQQAKNAHPSDGEAYYYTALVHERTGKKGPALTEYRRATELQLSPDLKEKAFWKLVLHYRHVQDWDNLYSVSQRFLAFRPNKEVEKLRDQAEANLNPARKRIQRLLADGAEAEKRGRLAEAASHYGEAARLDSDNVKTLWKAGDVYRKMDKCTDALRWYRKAVALDDDAWYSHYQAAVCQYRLLEFDAALVSFAKAEKRNEKPEASFRFYLNTGRGLAALELEDLDQANRALKIVRENKKLFSKSAPASILAAMTLLLNNDRTSIEPYLQRIGKDDPDRPAASLLKAIRSVNAADYEAAEEEIDELYIDASNTEEKRTNRLQRYTGQILILIAHHHLLNGRKSEAMKSIERYHSLKTGEIKGSLFLLASSNPMTPFREDRAELAARYSKDLRIFSRAPDQAAAIVEGRLLYEEDDEEKAVAVLQNATADPLCRFYLAELLFEKGDFAEARKHLSEALRADPSLMERLKENDDLYDFHITPDKAPEKR